MKPIDTQTVAEPLLLRHCVFVGDREVPEPGVIVATWPGEHLPVARVRVLANARLYDLSVGEFDLMGGQG